MKIKLDPEKQITLYNKEFDGMRNDLNVAIQKTLPKMFHKGINLASVTLKIEIGTIKQDVTDNNAPTGTREQVKVVMAYKVSTELKSKEEAKGSVVSLGDKKELLVDDSGRFFLVSSEEASGQLSMFNSFDEYVEEVTGSGNDDEEEDEEDADV